MITLPKTIQFTFPGASYVDWTITANSTCVTVDKTSGRSNTGTFTVTINAQFTDSSCVSSTVLTVTGVDNKSCTQTNTVTFTNPCSTLNTTLAPSGDLKVTATTTGGVAPYTFDWSYDTSKFTGTVNGTTLTLTPIDPANLLINTTTVYLQTTDVNGCSTTDSYAVTVPQVSFPNRFNTVATCYQNVITWTLYIENASDFDQTYINVQNEDITAVWEPNGFLKFSIPDVDYDFNHDLQLRTNAGRLTHNAIVDVKTNLCSELDIPALRVEQKIGGSSVGVIREYNITDDGNVDYSAFEFVPSSGQSVAGGILTTALGVAELLPSKQIQYTVGTVGFDRVRFKAADVNGNPTEHIDLYIDPYNYPTPTASNFSLNGSVGALVEDDLALRFSDSIRSFEIVTAPTKGSLSFNGTVLRYLATSVGSDSIVLKAIGLNNIESANLTITITNVASGVAIPGTVCTGGNIDLTSLLVDYTAGGTWTQTSGTTVSLVDPTIVPFSGKPSGFYTFNYAVGVTSTDVTVEHRSYTIASESESFPSNFIMNLFGCSSDIVLEDMYVKVYRKVGSPPIIPDDYYETLPMTSLASGTAQWIYTPSCPAQHKAEAYVSGICGETLLYTTGIFAC